MTGDLAGMERAIRWRAHTVSTEELPGPAEAWHPKPDERVAILHLVTDEHDRWTFGSLRELHSEACHKEYLTAATDEGMARLRRYAKGHRAEVFPGMADRITVLPPRKFVRRLITVCYWNRWPLIGANLPRTLTRLAWDAYPSRPRSDPERVVQGRRRDFRLLLADLDSRRVPGKRVRDWHRPDLFVEAGGSGAFFRWAKPWWDEGRPHHSGQFADLLTIGDALNGRSDLSDLEAVARTFDVEWPALDDDTDPIDRLRAETTVAVSVYLAERIILAGLGMAPWRCWSTGSLAALALDQAKLVPPAAKLDETVLPEYMARMTASFLGGETAAQRIRQLLPISLIDRSSDFIRCATVTGAVDLLTCESIGCEPVDPDWLREQVSTLEPDLSAVGLCFAVVFPQGEILARRRERADQSYSTDVGPLDFHGPWPCHTLDLASAWVLGGQVPEIAQAWRLVPKGRTAGLRPFQLSSGRKINLRREHLGQALMEDRLRVKDDLSLSEAERERGVGLAKLFGQSIVYGLPSRKDLRTMIQPTGVEVLELDGSTRTRTSRRIEQNARWTFLPLAATVTACARFLSIRMRARVELRDGAWVAQMVDSLAVVTTPEGGKVETSAGLVQALSFDELADLMAEDDRYLEASPKLPVWKAETDSLSESTFACAWGPNKVVLLRQADGQLRIIRPCNTGLGGHLLDPTGQSDPLDEKGNHTWPVPFLETWIVRELARQAGVKASQRPPYPDSASRPVVRQLQVTTPEQWWRLRKLFPGADVRPWDRYFLMERDPFQRTPYGGQTAYCLDLPRPPDHWFEAEFRGSDGNPIQPSTESDALFRVLTFQEYLGEWAGTGRGPQVQGPLAICSRPNLVDLAGKDSITWDLVDNDPDANAAKGGTIIYGPVMPHTCAYPGCLEEIPQGRGTPAKWCQQHAKWSGRQRRAALNPVEPIRRLTKAERST